MLCSKIILLWPSETYSDAYTAAEISQVLTVFLYRPCSCRDILFLFWEGYQFFTA